MNTCVRIYPKDETSRFFLAFDPVSGLEVIMEGDENIFFLTTSGHGTPSETIQLAKSVVDFLNQI